jgi:hypothetical protein
MMMAVITALLAISTNHCSLKMLSQIKQNLHRISVLNAIHNPSQVSLPMKYRNDISIFSHYDERLMTYEIQFSIRIRLSRSAVDWQIIN